MKTNMKVNKTDLTHYNVQFKNSMKSLILQFL